MVFRHTAVLPTLVSLTGPQFVTLPLTQEHPVFQLHDLGTRELFLELCAATGQLCC